LPQGRLSLVQQHAAGVVVQLAPFFKGGNGDPGKEGLPGKAAPVSWIDLVVRPSVLAGLGTVGNSSGMVRTHAKIGEPAVHRFIPVPYDPALDAFYTTFSGGALGGLIVSRG
jgi:hypothetical protein